MKPWTGEVDAALVVAVGPAVAGADTVARVVADALAPPALLTVTVMGKLLATA